MDKIESLLQSLDDEANLHRAKSNKVFFKQQRISAMLREVKLAFEDLNEFIEEETANLNRE